MFISSMEGAKVYSHTGWGHDRIFPMDPPLRLGTKNWNLTGNFAEEKNNEKKYQILNDCDVNKYS